MATFAARVQNLIGTVASPASLDDWLTHAAKTFIDLVPEVEIAKHAIAVTVPDPDGVAANTHRILYVEKSGRGAMKVAPQLLAAVADPESIHSASDTFPVWTIAQGKVRVLPGGGTFYGVAYPTVVNTDQAITGLNPKYEHGVVLYACIQALQKQLSDLARTSLDGTSLVPPTPPTAPSAPNITYVNASGATVTPTTIGNLPAVPPAFSVVLPTKPTTTLSASAPTPPSAPSFIWTDAVVSTIADSFSLDLSSQYTALATALDTEEDIELADAKVREIQTRIQEFITESNLALEKAKANAQLASDVNKFNELQTLEEQVREYQSQLGRFSGQLDLYRADIELVSRKVGFDIENYKQESQNLLQESLGEFNEDVEEYRASVAKIMEQAKILLQEAITNASMTTDVAKQNAIYQFQAAVQDYAQELALYDTKLKAYQADVQMAIQDFMAKLQKFASEHDRIFQQLQSLKEQYVQFLQLHFGVAKPQ